MRRLDSPERGSGHSAARLAIFLLLMGAGAGCATVRASGSKPGCEALLASQGLCPDQQAAPSLPVAPVAAVAPVGGEEGDAGLPPPDGMGAGPKPPVEAFLDSLAQGEELSEPGARMAVTQFLDQHSIRIVNGQNYNKDDAIKSLTYDVLVLQELRPYPRAGSAEWIATVKRKFAETIVALPHGNATKVTILRGNAGLVLVARMAAAQLVRREAERQRGAEVWDLTTGAARTSPSSGAARTSPGAVVRTSPGSGVARPLIQSHGPSASIRKDLAGSLAKEAEAMRDAQARIAQYTIHPSYNKYDVERYVMMALLTAQAMKEQLIEMERSYGAKEAFPVFKAKVEERIRQKYQRIDPMLGSLKNPGIHLAVNTGGGTLWEAAKGIANGMIGIADRETGLRNVHEAAGDALGELGGFPFGGDSED